MSRDSSAADILAIVQAYIASHHDRDLTLTEAARAVPVSPYYLAHLFQRDLGTTFLKHLTRVRLEAACRMLASSNCPVSVVSARVGYRSPKRFRIQFRRAFDLSPTQYRSEIARRLSRVP